MREMVWFFIILILAPANLFVLIRLRALQKTNRARVSALAEQRAQLTVLNQKANRTYTTGLPVKASFFKDAAVALRGRGRGVCALAALDGDRFSKLYESYGRSMTDALTVRIAEILEGLFPENENQMLCNVGDRSDEFLLLLLNRSSRGSLLCEVEALRKKVCGMDYQFKGNPVRVTVSLGVAFPPEGMEDVEALYDAACKAQSSAKQAGGNCIRTCG